MQLLRCIVSLCVGLVGSAQASEILVAGVLASPDDGSRYTLANAAFVDQDNLIFVIDKIGERAGPLPSEIEAGAYLRRYNVSSRTFSPPVLLGGTERSVSPNVAGANGHGRVIWSAPGVGDSHSVYLARVRSDGALDCAGATCAFILVRNCCTSA